MMFGFFTQPHLIDEMDSLGFLVSANSRQYEAGFTLAPGIVRGPTIDEFNINAVAEPVPDQQALATINYVTYNGIKNGSVSSVSGVRGWKYITNTVRLSIRMRKRVFKGHEVFTFYAASSTYTRTGVIDVTTWRHVTRMTFGNTPGNTGIGAVATITGLVGQARNLKDFRYASSGTIQFATIQRRFSDALEIIEISQCATTAIALIINDRLQDAVNVKDLWLGYATVTTYKSSPAYGGPVNSILASDHLTGYTTLNVSHMPLLRALVIGNASLTSLTLPAAPPLELLVVYNCIGITTDVQTAINKLFASGVAVKLISHINNLTWTRNIGAADVATSMTVIMVNKSVTGVWTGNITLSAARPNLAILTFGDAAISVTAANKNNFGAVDISGCTGLTSLDLSNCRITDLTLPTSAPGLTYLGLAGNKLDYITSPTLITRLAAMTAVTELYLSTAIVTANIIDSGQDSVNGLGPNVNLSTLTVCTALYATKCKLTGTFTVPNSVVTLILFDNNISALNGGGSVLNQLRMTNNSANVDFSINNRHNMVTLWLDNTGQVGINLAGRTNTAVSGLFNITNNAVLTSFTFPTNPACAVYSDDAITISGNPLLTTLNNLVSVTCQISSLGSISFVGNALNINFDFGSRSLWYPRVIALQNNGMTQAIVNANINSIWTNRRAWDVYNDSTTRSFNIAGTNAAPSGTYVAPAGYKSANITGITQATTAVMTFTAITGTFANNDVIRPRNVLGMAQVNRKYYMLKNIVGNTAELWNEAGTAPIDSTAFGAYTSAGSCYVEGAPANEKEKCWTLTSTYAISNTIN